MLRSKNRSKIENISFDYVTEIAFHKTSRHGLESVVRVVMAIHDVTFIPCDQLFGDALLAVCDELLTLW